MQRTNNNEGFAYVGLGKPFGGGRRFRCHAEGLGASLACRGKMRETLLVSCKPTLQPVSWMQR